MIKYRIKHNDPFKIIFRVFLDIFHIEMYNDKKYKENGIC